jgi:hypothetical protein
LRADDGQAASLTARHMLPPFEGVQHAGTLPD